MIAKGVALLRASRLLQVTIAVAAVLGTTFAWYTISPLFIRTTVVETTGAAVGGSLLARGDLRRVDDVHRGSGPVAIVETEGRRFVRFEDVAIANGPDLYVFLARGTGGAYDARADLNLGRLKATNGTFAYEVPANANLVEYRSVIVWCRAFSVLFTWADLRAAN